MKIRGQKRIRKGLADWIERNKKLDLDFVKNQGRWYTKLRIYPWNSLCYNHQKSLNPKGKSKALLVNGLIEIHDSWQAQFEALGEPYWLRIHLYDPRITKSQVLCGFGREVSNAIFIPHDPSIPKKINPENYGSLSSKISKFDWEYRWDEDFFDDGNINNPDDFMDKKNYQKYLIHHNKQLKKKHRVEKFAAPEFGITESYYFKKGDVWIGEKPFEQR